MSPGFPASLTHVEPLEKPLPVDGCTNQETWVGERMIPKTRSALTASGEDLSLAELRAGERLVVFAVATRVEIREDTLVTLSDASRTRLPRLFEPVGGEQGVIPVTADAVGRIGSTHRTFSFRLPLRAPPPPTETDVFPSRILPPGDARRSRAPKAPGNAATRFGLLLPKR